ncbi:MAG: transcriptional regulator [Cyclobacteriaceae bacterium]
MIAIITGDIVGSQSVTPEIWLQVLKTELGSWGKSPLTWELYRGDSFQLKIPDISQALEAGIKIKAAIKSIDPLDVRMSIGLGEENYKAKKLLESNGTAYVNSGEGFEALENTKQNILIKSPSESFDREINMMLKLGLKIMDRWTATSAKMIHLAILYPKKTQKQLGQLENISQHAVSARLSRADFDVIQEFQNYFMYRVKNLA